MVDVGKLRIEIEADVKKLKTEMGKVKTELEKVKDESEKTQKGFHGLDIATLKLAAGYLGLGLSIKAVTGFMKECIEAFGAEEMASARLTQALKNQNQYTEENYATLSNLASQLQRTTIFSDEQTKSAMAMLASFKFTAAQIYELTPIMQDLAIMTARTTGGMSDLEGIAKLVGLAMEGQAGRLRQAGISITDLQEDLLKIATPSEKVAILMKIMQDNAGGLAEATGVTATAGIIQMRNSLNDLQESIGGILVRGTLPLVESLSNIFWGLDVLTKGLDKTKIGVDSNTEAWSLLTYLQWIAFGRIMIYGEALGEARDAMFEVQKSTFDLNSETDVTIKNYSVWKAVVAEQTLNLNEIKGVLEAVNREMSWYNSLSLEGETALRGEILASEKKIAQQNLIIARIKETDGALAGENKAYRAAMNIVEEETLLLEKLRAEHTLNIDIRRKEIDLKLQEGEDMAKGVVEVGEAESKTWEEQLGKFREMGMRRGLIELENYNKSKIISDSEILMLKSKITEAEKFNKTIAELPEMKTITIKIKYVEEGKPPIGEEIVEEEIREMKK